MESKTSSIEKRAAVTIITVGSCAKVGGIAVVRRKAWKERGPQRAFVRWSEFKEAASYRDLSELQIVNSVTDSSQ